MLRFGIALCTILLLCLTLLVPLTQASPLDHTDLNTEHSTQITQHPLTDLLLLATPVVNSEQASLNQRSELAIWPFRRRRCRGCCEVNPVELTSCHVNAATDDDVGWSLT